ncbi:uncharacterized protein LOC106056111 isoform X3 [Biomphalaria glabrata]|uniref:Uncharacterized protein LOC106056111 isoform X3 n=1 Tax=Biomphalaria glabrata TaxID=6526 RepID=A0A9W3A4I9_BIOGL|nr:uncharacterized protein LOC106056111 isoform X3 [Biomphalaria glabrata]
MDGIELNRDTFQSKPDGGTTKRKPLLKSNGPLFTIPKLKKIKRDLLTDLTLDSHECQHDILAPVRKSFHFPVSSSCHEFTKVQAVYNPEISAKYMERRREMKVAGYSDSLLAEMFAFIPVENPSSAERICQEGIRCGNQQFSGLGVSHMAVHVCKHADIVSASRPKVGEKILLVVKVVKGKMKTVLCKNVGVQLEPTPNYDCHIAKPNVDQATQLAPHMLLYTTQLYLYEYSDCEIVDYPRQVLPYAVVYYTYKEPQPMIPKPITSTPQSQLPMPSVVPPLSSTQTPVNPHQSQAAQHQDCGPCNEVWRGRLHVRLEAGGQIYIDVTMLSHFVPLTINLISPILIHHLYPEHNAQFTFFCGLSNIALKDEVEWRAHFFKSFLMRPRPNNEEHFKALVKHISAKREMPTVKLPNDVFLFMMPNCLLASQLGLVRRDDDTPVLHCVLMSKYSTNEAQRKKLLDRKTIFKNYGSATSWESLFDDSDFTDEEDVKMKGQLSGSISSMFQEQRYIQNKLAAMSIVDADMNFTRCSCRKLSSSKAHYQRCRDSDVARVLAACQSSGKKMSQPAVQDRSQHRPKQKMSKRTKSMPSFSPHGSDSDSEVENGKGTSRRRKDRLTLLSSTKTVEEELSEEELTNEQMEDIIFLRKPALTTVSRPKPPSQAHKNSSSSFQNNQKHSRAKSAVPQPSSDLHKSSSEPLFNIKPRIIPTEPLEPVTLPKTKIIPSEPRLIPTEPVDNLEGTKTSKKENDKPLKNELNFRNIHQVIDRTLKSELATSKLVKPEQSLGKPLNPGINTGKHSSLTVPVSKSSNPEVITSKPLNSGITTSKSSNPGVISSKTELISTSQISQPELMSGKPLKPVLSTNKLSNPEPDITTSKPSASQDNFVPKSILKKNSDLLVPTIIEPIPPVSVDEVSGSPKKKLARLEEDFGDVDMRIPMAGPVTLHPVFLAARQPPAIILSPPTTEPTQHSPNFSLGSWLAPSEIQGARVPPNACDVISSMSPTSPESPPIGSPPSPVDSPLSPPMDSHSPPHSPITVIDTESPASPPQSSLQDRFRSSPIAIPTTRIIHNTSPDISRLSSPACSSGSRERIDNANDMKNFLNSGFDSDLDSSYEDESVVTDQEICVSCSHYPVARQKETVWKDNKTQVQENPNQSACKHGDQRSEDTVREAHNAKDSSLSPDYQIAAKTFTVSCVYTDCICVDMGKLFSNPILQSCMQECTKPTCVDSDTSHEPCVSNRDAVADGHCISETKTWKQTLDVKTDSERVNILESQTESLLLADSIVRRCTNKYKKSLADATLSSAYSFCNQWEEKRDHPGKCMILKNAVALREIENCSDSPMDSWCKEMRSEKAHLFGSGHCILGQCDLVTVWPCSVKSETGQTDDAPSHENQLQVFQESASQDTVSVAQIKLSSGVKDFGEHSHESAEMQKETNLSDLESQQLSCSYSHNGLLDTSAKKNPANEAKNPSKLLFKNISEGKKHRKSHHAKAGYDPSHTNSSSRDDRQKKRDGIERNPTDKKNQPRKPKESNPKHHEDQGYSGSKQKPVQVTATIKTTNQINNQPISNSSKHLNQRELQPIDQLEQDLSKLKTDISVEIPDQWDGNADQQKRLHKNKCLSDVPKSTDLVQSICSSPPCLQRKSHYHPRSSHQANDQKDPSKKLLISRDVLQQCFSDQFKGMTMSVLADSKFAVCDTQSHNDSEQSHQFSIAHSVLDEVKFPDYGTTSSNNNLLLGSNIEGSITDVSDVDSRDVYNNNSNYLMSASTFECSYRNQSVAFEDGTKSKVKESHSKSGQTHSNKSHCDDKHPKHCHGNFSIKGSVMSHYDGNDNYLEKCHGTDSIRDPNNLNQNASDKHPNKCHGKGSIRDHIKFNQNASDKHPNRCHNKSSIDVPNWSYHYDSEKHPNKCHERCTIKDFYKSHHYDSEKHPNKSHGNKDPSKHQIKENQKNSYKYHSTDSHPHNDNDKDSHSDFNRSLTRDSNLYPNKCHSKDSHNDPLKYHKGSNNSKKKHHLKDSNHLWEKETQLKLHNSSEIKTDHSHNKQEHRIKIDCLSSSANSPSESSACTDLDYVKHAEGEISTQENAKRNEQRIIQTFNLMHRRDIRPTRHKVSRSKRFRNTTKSRRKHEEKLLYSCETEVDSPPPCYQRKGIELCPTAAGHKKQKNQRHREITCSKRYFSRSKVRFKADNYDASSEDEDKDKMWSLSLSIGKLGSQMACTTPRLQRDFIRDGHPCIEDIDDSGFASIPLSMRSVTNRGDTLVSSHRVVSKSLFQEDTLKNQSFNTLEKSQSGSLVRECFYETDNFSVHDTPEECDSDNSWFMFARRINRKNQVHVCQPSPLTQRNLGETQTTQYNEDIDSFQEVKPFISQLEQLTYYRIEEQVGSMAVQDEQLGFGYMKRSPQDPNCNLGEPCVVIDRVEETMEDFFLDQAERDCTNPSALTQLDSLTEQPLAQSEGNMHSSPLHPTMDTYNDTNQILQTHSDTSEKHQSGHPSYNRVQEDFSTQKHRNIKPKKKSLLYQCSSSQSEPSLLQNSLTNKDVEEMNQCSNKTSSFLESRNKSMSAYQSPNWPAEEYSTSNSVYHYRAIIDQYRPINAPLPEKDNRWSYMNRDKEELSAPFLQDSHRDHTCNFSPISTNSTLTALDIVLETDEDIKKQETEDEVTCDSDLARKQNQVMPNLNVYRKIQTDRSPIDLANVHKHSPDRSTNTVVPDQTHTKVCRNIFTDIQPVVLKTHTSMNESHDVMIDKSSVEKNTDKSQALLDKQCHNQSALNDTLHNKASLSQFSCRQLSQSQLSSRHPCKETNDVRFSSSESDEGMSAQLKNIVEQVISGHSRPSDKETILSPCDPLVSNSNETVEICYKQQVISSTDQSLPWITIASPDLSQQETIQNKKHQSSFSEQNVNISSRKINFSLNKVNNWLTAEKGYLFPASSRQQTSMDDTNRPFNDSQSLNQSSSRSQRTCDSDNGNRLLASNTPSLPADKHWTIPKRGDSSVCTSLSYEHIPDLQAMNNLSKNSSRTFLEEEGNSDDCSMPQADLYLSQTNRNLENGHLLSFEQPEEKDFSKDKFCLSQDGSNSYPVMNSSKTDNVSSSSSDHHTLDETMNSNDMSDGDIYLTDTEYVLNNICRPCSVSLCDVDKCFNLCGGNSFYFTSESISRVCRIPSRPTARPSESLNSLASSSKIPEHKSCVEENTCQGMDDVQEIQAGSEAHGVEMNEKSRLKENNKGESHLRVTEGESHLRVTEGESHLRVTEGESHLRVTEGESHLRVTEGDSHLRVSNNEAHLIETDGQSLLMKTEPDRHHAGIAGESNVMPIDSDTLVEGGCRLGETDDFLKSEEDEGYWVGVENHLTKIDGECHLEKTDWESHLMVTEDESHLMQTDGDYNMFNRNQPKHCESQSDSVLGLQSVTNTTYALSSSNNKNATQKYAMIKVDNGGALITIPIWNQVAEDEVKDKKQKKNKRKTSSKENTEKQTCNKSGHSVSKENTEKQTCNKSGLSVSKENTEKQTCNKSGHSVSKENTEKQTCNKSGLSVSKENTEKQTCNKSGLSVSKENTEKQTCNKSGHSVSKENTEKQTCNKSGHSVSKENTEKQTCNKSGLSVSKENTEKQTCNKSGLSVSKENTEKQTCNKSGHSVSKENTEKQTCNKSGLSVSKENTEKQTCNKSGHSVSKETTEKQTSIKSGLSVSKETTEKQTCNKSGHPVSKRKATSEQEDLISVKRKKMNPSQDNMSVKQQPASSVGGNEVEETISGQEKLLIENYLFPTSVNRYKFQGQLITQTEQHSQKSGENMLAKSKKQTSKQQTLSEQQTSKLQTLSEPIRDVVTSEDTSNGNKTNEVIVDANVESKAQSEVSMNSFCPSNRQNIPSKRIYEPVDCQASVQGSDEMKEEINDNTVFPSPTCSTPDALKFPPTGTSSSLSSKELCKAKEKTSKVNTASKHQTSVKVNKCTKDHKSNKEHKSSEHHTTSTKEHKSLKGDLSTHEPKSLTDQTAKESKSSKKDTTSHKSSKHHTTSTKENKSSKGDLSTNEPKSLTDQTAKDIESSKNDTTSHKKHKSSKHHTTSNKEHKSSKGDLSTKEPKSLTDQTAKESTSSKNDTTSNKEHKSSKHHTTSNKEHKSLKGDLLTKEPKSLTDQTAKESTSSKNDTTSKKEHKSSKCNLSANEPKSLIDLTSAKESKSSKIDTTFNKEHKTSKHHTTSNKELKSSNGNLSTYEPQSLIHQTSVKENKSSKNDTISNKKHKSLVGDLSANEPKTLIDQTSAKEIKSSENHTTSHKEQNTSKGDLPAKEPKSLPDQKAKEIKSTKKDTIINKEQKSSKHHISSNKEHKSSKHQATSNKEHKTSEENLSSNEPKSLIDQTSAKGSKPSKNHTTSNKEHKSSKEHKTDKMQKTTREHIASKEHTSDEKHFVQDNKSTEEHKLTKEHLLSKKQISSKEHTSAKECLSNIEHNSSKKHTSVKEHTSSREHASSKKQTSVKEQTSGKEHSSGKDNFSSQERIAFSSIACNKDLLPTKEQIAAEEKRSIHKPFKLCKHMSTKQHKNKEHTSSELKPSKHIAPEKKHKPSKEHSSAKELKPGKTDKTDSLITKNKVISSLLKDIVSQLDANSAAWHSENTNLRSTKDNKQAIKVIKQLPENNQLAVDLHGDNKPEVNNQFSEDSDLAHQVNNLVFNDNKIAFEVSNQLSEDNNLELEVNHQVPADDKLADEVINQLPEDKKLALEVNNQLSEDNNLELEVNHQVPADDKLADEVINQLPEDQKLALEVNTQLSEDNELALEVDNKITEDSKVALEVNNDLLQDSNLALEDNVQKHEVNKVALEVNNQLPGNYELLLEVNDQLPEDNKLIPEVSSHPSETKQEFEVRHHLPEDHNLILIKSEAPLSINSEATVDMLEPDLKKQTDVINELAPEVNKKPFEVNNQVHILNCQPQEVNKKAKKRKVDHEKNLADKPGTFCPSAQHNETLTDRLETSSVTEEGNDDVDKINTNSHKEEHPLQSSKKATISFSSDAKKPSMQSQSSLLLDQTATMAGFASGSGNQKVTSKEVKRKADEALSGEQYTKKPAHVMWSNWKIPKKKKNELSAKCIEEQPQKSKDDRTDAMKLDFGRFHLPMSSSHKQTSSYLQTSSNQASSSCQSLKRNKIQVCSGQQLLNSSNPAKKTIFGSNSKKDNCESTPRNIVSEKQQIIKRTDNSKKQQIIRTTYTSEKKIMQTSDTSKKQEYKNTHHSIVSEKHLDTHIMREQPDEMFSTSERPEKDVLEGQCDIFKNKEKRESPETLCPEVEPIAKCETAAIKPQVTNNESEVVAEMTYTDTVSTAVHLEGATVSLDKDENDDPVHLKINFTPLDLQRTTSAVDDLEKTENDLPSSEGKVDKSSESFPTVNLRDSQDITHGMEFLKKDNGDRRHMEQDSLEGEICKGKPCSFLEEMACTANHCDMNIGQNQDPMVTHLSGNCPLNDSDDPSNLSNLNIDSKNYSCKSSVKGMADMTEQGSLRVKAMLSSANLELNHGNAHEQIQERKVTDRPEWNSSPVRGLQDKTEESCEPTNSAGDVQDYQKMCDEAPACSSKADFSHRDRSNEHISEDRKSRRAHPYSRPERKDFASFNLPYKDLAELMQSLTTETFKQSKKCYPIQNKPVKRFASYCFKRSSVPKSKGKEKATIKLVRPEDIPDIDKRKHLADEVENLTVISGDEVAKKTLEDILQMYPSIEKSNTKELGSDEIVEVKDTVNQKSTENSSQQPGQSEEITPGVHECESAAKGQKYKIHPFNSGSDMSLDEDNCDTHCRIIYVRSAHTSAKLADTQSETCLSDKGSSHSDLVSRASVSDTGLASQVKSFSSGHECETKSDSDLKASVNAASYFNFSCRHFSSFNTLYSLPSFSDMSSNEPRTIAPNLFPHMAYRDPCSAQQSPQNKQSSPAFISKRKRQQMMKVTKCNLEKSSEFMLVIQSLKDLKLSPHRSEKRDLKLAKPTQPFCLEMSPSSENPVCVEHPTHPSHIEHQSHPKMPLCTKQSPCREQIYLDHPELPGQTSCSPHSSFPNQPSVSPHSSFPNQPSVSPHSSFPNQPSVSPHSLLPNHPSCSPHSSLTNHPSCSPHSSLTNHPSCSPHSSLTNHPSLPPLMLHPSFPQPPLFLKQSLIQKYSLYLEQSPLIQPHPMYLEQPPLIQPHPMYPKQPPLIQPHPMYPEQPPLIQPLPMYPEQPPLIQPHPMYPDQSSFPQYPPFLEEPVLPQPSLLTEQQPQHIELPVTRINEAVSPTSKSLKSCHQLRSNLCSPSTEHHTLTSPQVSLSNTCASNSDETVDIEPDNHGSCSQTWAEQEPPPQVEETESSNSTLEILQKYLITASRLISDSEHARQLKQCKKTKPHTVSGQSVDSDLNTSGTQSGELSENMSHIVQDGETSSNQELGQPNDALKLSNAKNKMRLTDLLYIKKQRELTAEENTQLSKLLALVKTKVLEKQKQVLPSSHDHLIGGHPPGLSSKISEIVQLRKWSLHKITIEGRTNVYTCNPDIDSEVDCITDTSRDPRLQQPDIQLVRKLHKSTRRIPLEPVKQNDNLL